MEYRIMNKLGVKTSLLGFGCMRFPTKDGKILEDEAEKMIDYAYQHGVNYYDTAYPYHNGESEHTIGKFLDKYDRDSYFVATKLPVMNIETLEDSKRIFEEQLTRLHKDYIDFYLLHAVNKDRYQKVKDLGILEYMEELKKAGKIRYFGFSFHDEYPVFEEVLKDYPWDFVQIQLNYMDKPFQAGEKGYALAEKMNIPMVIMEPLKGGNLCNFSEDITERFHQHDKDASVASFGLRWVASHPNIKVILSGMSTWEQVEDNIKTFTNYKPLSDDEKTTIEVVTNIINSRIQNSCTACRYCMPCPSGVNIPLNFYMWNTYHMYQNYNIVKYDWEKRMEKEGVKASSCVSCGLCETKCPQKIEIRKDLAKVLEDLNHPIYCN